MPKETHEKIITAFLRLAVRNPETWLIGLEDVAEEANITVRSIKRKHFSTTYDIIKELRESISDDVQAALADHGIETDNPPAEIFVSKLLPVLYMHRDVLHIFYTTTIDPTWPDYVERTYTDWMKPYFLDTEVRIGFTMETTFGLATKWFLAIIAAWMSEEVPDPPKVFGPKFLRLMHLSLNDLIAEPFRLSPLLGGELFEKH